MSVVFAIDFPNPVSWTIDKIGGFVGDMAKEGFEKVLGGLVAWVVDAVVWVATSVFSYFMTATDPNVQADWFRSGDGPFGASMRIAAVLLLGFLLAGIIQGVATADVAGMVRRMVVHLPVAVFGMVAVVSITQALVGTTDAMAKDVLNHFSDDLASFSTVVGSLAALRGGIATALVVFLLGLIAVIGGLIVLAELVVRSSLIYLVTALSPLVFATLVWPALRGMSRKMLELLGALIISKLVIAMALGLAAAALAGTGSGGQVSALPPPEVAANDPAGSVTQGVGILLAGLVTFVVAAFSPLLVLKLMPIAEAAVVAAGIKGMPVRGAMAAASLATGATAVAGRAAGAASLATRAAPASSESSSGPSASSGSAPRNAGGDAGRGWRPVPNTGPEPAPGANSATEPQAPTTKTRDPVPSRQPVTSHQPGGRA